MIIYINYSMEAFAHDKWYDLAVEKFALTIQDIINLKQNGKLEILVLDRNVWDIALNEKTNKPNVNYDPETFFRFNRGTYTHNDSMKGTMVFHWEDENFVDNCFEFDLEYMEKNWYPLKNGMLPKELYNGWEKDKHWTDFLITTKVGYRGPMILWDKLKEMPKIVQDLTDIYDAFIDKNNIPSERYFKITNEITGEFYGRYSGQRPENAANKCILSLANKLRTENKEMCDDIKLSVQETTRGSKCNLYHFLASAKKYNVMNCK